MTYAPWQYIDEPWARDGLPNDPMADAMERETERRMKLDEATVIMRQADLRPGDVYATEQGRPVIDVVASGYPPAGYIGTWTREVHDVPLSVARVAEFYHDGIRMLYVEASNGHGGSAGWPGVKSRIMRRSV
jgi:hypothetical protein